MPASLEELKPEHCPILKRFPEKLAPVLAVYNLAVQVHNKLAGQFPGVLEQPELAESLARLAKAREELVTPRFKVGFLGRYQGGKSTMMNNLLGAEISGTGAGEATTSVITRLIVGKAGVDPTLALRYFTADEYVKRRNTLCEWIRIPNPEGSSEYNLIEKLKTHNPGRGSSANSRTVTPKDKPYLTAFLQSFDHPRWKTFVQSPAITESVRFKDKDTLLTHGNDEQGQTKPSQYLLLSESEIRFHTDTIDPEIELVDCPGLGSGRSVDDLLTKEYIPELNGALVFLQADSMYSTQVIEILEDLKYRFKDSLRSRVWIVVNKMDVPDRKAKLVGDTSGKTTFDLITQLESAHGIPLSQVCLGCNRIFQLAKNNGGVADRTKAMEKLDLAEPGDEKTVKGVLAKYPALDAAFEEMLKDGSIAHMRKLIREQIGPSVANEIFAQAARDAQQAASDLEYAFKECEQPANEQERQAALAWQEALSEMMIDLRVTDDGERGELFVKLIDLGSGARKALEAEFVRFANDRILNAMTLPELYERFQVDSDRMQREVDKQFESLIQSLYTEVTVKFDGKTLPPVTLPGGRDIAAVWQECRQQDRDGGPWRDRMRPCLTEDQLMRRMSEPGVCVLFDGAKYKKLILDKIRTAAQQITLAVRGRLHVRLDDLRKQVTRKLVTTKKTSR